MAVLPSRLRRRSDLPPVATAGLHKGSIDRCLWWLHRNRSARGAPLAADLASRLDATGERPYIRRVELVVYAEANQFIVCGAGAESSDDEEDEVSNTELAVHIAARLGALVVFTASYGVVSVCLESLPSAPAEDISSHDHVVDASLDCPEGELLILEDGTEVRARLAVPRGMNRVRIGWDNIVKGDPVLAEEPLERLTIQVWPGESTAPRVLRWYEGWRPRAAPTNPHGLRALAGAEIDHSGMRAIGECPRSDGSSTVLIVDADGVYWEQDYRTEPPYDEILFELPKSELDRFELD
jgi:hypothetical protein